MICPVLEGAVGVITKATLATFPVTHLEGSGRTERVGAGKGRERSSRARRQGWGLLHSIQLS